MKALADVQESPWRLLETVSGSKAYGTETPESDTDIRGVFVWPSNVFYGFDPPPQVSDATHDITYYELSRFTELLAKNNPNVLELLFMPEDCIRHQHPLFAKFAPEMVLSRRCRETFAGYAMGQVRKARGLNKKIVNPMAEERRTPQDFCYVLDGQGSIPLRDWLVTQDVEAKHCGLVSVPHLRDLYGLYHDPNQAYRGLFCDEEATEVRFSSIAKDAQPVAWMGFNKDAYKRYCREHREYWDWVENRNEARYATNVGHGRHYDSKNLMHTFRLLDMAEEIAREGRFRVRRPNASHLLRIREGAFDYDDLVALAEQRVEEIDALFEQSPLPESPDQEGLEQVMIEIRESMYESAATDLPGFPCGHG